MAVTVGPTATAGAARRLFAALAVTTTAGFGLLLYTVSVMLDPMMADLGWSTAALSAGPTIGLAVSGLCAPAIGRTIDLHGGRTVMTLGTVLGGAGVLLWSAAHHYPLYLAAWVVIGVGMAMSLYEPAFATIVRHAPDRRREGILGVTLLGALASTIFIPVAALLVDAVAWRIALVVLAIGHVVISAPLCLLWVPRGQAVAATQLSEVSEASDREPTGPPPQRQTQPSATPAGDPGDRGDRGVPVVAPTLMTSPRLRRIVLAHVLGGSATQAVGVHLVAALVAAGRTPGRAAAIASLLGIAKVAGRLAVGAAAKRAGTHPLLVACLVVMGVGLAIPVAIPTGTSDVIMVLAFGAGAGGMTVMKPLFLVDQFGPAVYGVTAGRMSRVGKLSFAGAPLLVGAIVTLTARHDPAWVLLAAGCVLAALILPTGRGAASRPRRPTPSGGGPGS